MATRRTAKARATVAAKQRKAERAARERDAEARARERAEAADVAGAEETEEEEAEVEESEVLGDDGGASAAFEDPLSVVVDVLANGESPGTFRSLLQAGVQTEEALRMFKEFQQEMSAAASS